VQRLDAKRKTPKKQSKLQSVNNRPNDGAKQKKYRDKQKTQGKELRYKKIRHQKQGEFNSKSFLKFQERTGRQPLYLFSIINPKKIKTLMFCICTVQQRFFCRRRFFSR
jgi:hypothetical protein